MALHPMPIPINDDCSVEAIRKESLGSLYGPLSHWANNPVGAGGFIFIQPLEVSL